MATTTKGAAPAAPAGRSYLGRTEFYKSAFGADRCDLCGEPAAELARIVLEQGRTVVDADDGRKYYRAARVAYICKRHRGEDAVGAPIAAPNLTTAPGTSRLRPQELALFDDTSLKKGASR